jgi:hypothetical protein
VIWIPDFASLHPGLSFQGRARTKATLATERSAVPRPQVSDRHDKTIKSEAASIVASSRWRWALFAWVETLASDVH